MGQNFIGLDSCTCTSQLLFFLMSTSTMWYIKHDRLFHCTSKYSCWTELKKDGRQTLSCLEMYWGAVVAQSQNSYHTTQFCLCLLFLNLPWSITTAWRWHFNGTCKWQISVTTQSDTLLIIYMKTLFDSDWLRGVQFKCNTSANYTS